ncbi:hypothetical protein GCM10023147_01130 [Tsukamurella soli]|uniref:Uncharacterized protein n=1 Tax=Tsukamurella soli TaxID=644556 RepID=A0ABP8J0N4_9ACTN
MTAAQVKTVLSGIESTKTATALSAKLGTDITTLTKGESAVSISSKSSLTAFVKTLQTAQTDKSLTGAKADATLASIQADAKALGAKIK